ncbi:hypothetical protein WMY93_000184 [Mugilogobius chulae]|uniref:Uncharacterized protein n=1 Tax=Mugilogobius chulae TaxID=88201 RepID=A0AAW0Q070_9GOBI
MAVRVRDSPPRAHALLVAGTREGGAHVSHGLQLGARSALGDLRLFPERGNVPEAFEKFNSGAAVAQREESKLRLGCQLCPNLQDASLRTALLQTCRTRLYAQHISKPTGCAFTHGMSPNLQGALLRTALGEG